MILQPSIYLSYTTKCILLSDQRSTLCCYFPIAFSLGPFHAAGFNISIHKCTSDSYTILLSSVKNICQRQIRDWIWRKIGREKWIKFRETVWCLCSHNFDENRQVAFGSSDIVTKKKVLRNHNVNTSDYEKVYSRIKCHTQIYVLSESKENHLNTVVNTSSARLTLKAQQFSYRESASSVIFLRQIYNISLPSINL